MTLYVYSLYEDEAPYAEGGEADFDTVMGLHGAFATAVKDAGGKIMAGEALRGIATATFLRHTNTPQVDVIDNPLPEVKEVLGGFYVIDVPDEQTARALAEKAPAPYGYVEFRPVWVFD